MLKDRDGIRRPIRTRLEQKAAVDQVLRRNNFFRTPYRPNPLLFKKFPPRRGYPRPKIQRLLTARLICIQSMVTQWQNSGPLATS
jgi:hypothetical protein